MADDIVLLREALIAMGRMIPGVILDDRVSNTFLANLPEEMAHYSLHRSPGQHDGAAGDEPFAYFQRNEGWDIWEQVADEHKDAHDGIVAAYRRPKPSTEQARAEGALSADIRRLVIAARIVTDAGVMDEDEQELLDAVEAFSSRVPYEDEPSGADALGDGR